MRKKILVFTPSFPFKNIHFHKDVMIIPKIISREYQMDTYVMTKKNESTYNSNESTHMIFSNSVFKNIWNFLKIKPDVVFTIHVARYTIFYVIIFKLLRKSTKIYLKIDGEYLCDVQSKIKKILISVFFFFPDAMSIESKKGCNFLKENYGKYSDKIFYLPNGYDPKLFSPYTYTGKEDLIITVGRLGTYQKNTELFLDVIIELLKKHSHYKVCLVGKMENNFEKYFNNFLEKNSQFSQRITYMGEIHNREKLITLYKKSKFFLLTSRFDITPNVYVEAGYFGNILVTTDVGGAYDITNNEKHGCVFQQKNYIKAIDYISQHISNNDVHIYGNKSTNFIQDQFNYVSYLKNIINTF